MKFENADSMMAPIHDITYLLMQSNTQNQWKGDDSLLTVKAGIRTKKTCKKKVIHTKDMDQNFRKQQIDQATISKSIQSKRKKSKKRNRKTNFNQQDDTGMTEVHSNHDKELRETLTTITKEEMNQNNHSGNSCALSTATTKEEKAKSSRENNCLITKDMMSQIDNSMRSIIVDKTQIVCKDGENITKKSSQSAGKVNDNDLNTSE
jgi:hypothetical protein